MSATLTPTSRTAEPTPAAAPDAASNAAPLAAEDLAEVMSAYNAVTERLQASHEALAAETVRLRDELASTNAQLQRSKRLSALGEMAAGIAHEIRNPLAAIQLYAEMAAADLEQPEAAIASAHGNTTRIVTAVRGLSNIVQDVLAFATQIQPHARPVDAGTLFAGIAETHRPALDAAAVTLRHFDDGQLLHADPDLLRRALLNLVRNATDALAQQPEGRPRCVTLSSEGGRTLVISDTGPGIPDDVAERIFNPFFTTRSTGTGLGLAIVHRIVDAHGGTIGLGRTRSGGARFTIELPPGRPADRTVFSDPQAPASPH